MKILVQSKNFKNKTMSSNKLIIKKKLNQTLINLKLIIILIPKKKSPI